MKNRLFLFKGIHFYLLLTLSLYFNSTLVFSQFSTPTINGTLGTDEYETGNANNYGSGATTWYMIWDNNYLYIFINNANNAEAGIVYFDLTPDLPVNGNIGATGGTTVGFAYDGLGAPNLPFSANTVIYFKNDYREIRRYNGSTWNLISSGNGGLGGGSNDYSDGYYATTSGPDKRELKISWCTLTGGSSSCRPSDFNWNGYIAYNNGSYAQLPIENPSGNHSPGTVHDYIRYFTVSSTVDGASTHPMGRNSYTHIGNDIASFGAIAVWDFTMNSSGKTITRSSGDWTIGGNLRIENGTIHFGSTSSPCYLSGDIYNNGSLNLSSVSGGDIYVGGNWSKGNSGTFTPNNRAVFFNGNSNQTISVTGGGAESFSYLLINKTAGNLILSSSPATNINITGTSENILQLQNTGGLDLNGQTCTITNTGVNIDLNSGSRTISSSLANGTFAITGSAGSVGLSNAGTLTFDTNITLSLSRGFNPSGSAITTLNGTLQINTGGYLATNTLTYGSGATLIYLSTAYSTSNEWLSGSSTGAGVPYNVILNMSGVSSALTTTGTRTVPGSLTVTQGELNADFALDILGNVTIATNGLLDGTDNIVKVSGDWSANSTISGNGYTSGTTGTLEFNGSGIRVFSHVGGATVRNLIFSGSGSYTINNDINAQTLTTISNGIIDFGTNRLYGSSGLTMSGGTLKLGRLSTTLPEIDGTYTLTSSGTIELNGAGNQQLRGSRSYTNLTFSNSGTKTLSSSITGTNTITGTVTISNDAILYTVGQTLGGAGTNLTMTDNAQHITGGAGTKPDPSGTYSIGTGTTIEYAGTANANPRVSGISYYNVIISGTNVNTTGIGTGLTFQSGGSFTVKNGALFGFVDPQGFSGSATTAINNTNTPTIVLETGSTIDYRRLDIQTITTGVNYPNLTISGGDTDVKTLAGHITVLENLNLNTTSTGAIADAGFTINLGGNITGTGTHTSSVGGKILMTGTAASISGATLGNLELDDNSTFTLTGSPTITGTLTFTNGKLSLGAYDISMTSTTAPFAGYSTDKFILTNSTGVIKQTINSGSTGVYLFPVGATISGNDYYNPATIIWQDNADITQLSARFVPSSLPNPTGITSSAYGVESTPVTSFLNNGYWEINAPVSSTAEYQINVTNRGSSNIAPYAEQHTLFKNSTVSATGWTQVGDAVDIWNSAAPDPDPTSGFGGVLSTQNINTSGFSIFGIGRSENGYVLPIILTSFDAWLVNADVILNWSTASEINNDYFQIERSMDGVIWSSIGQVDGAGNTFTPQHYEFTDTNAPGTIIYYRLQQIDFNGDSEYSDIEVVDNTGNGELIIYGYYNVTGQWFTNLENAAAGIYLQVSNKGNIQVLHLEK